MSRNVVTFLPLLAFMTALGIAGYFLLIAPAPSVVVAVTEEISATPVAAVSPSPTAVQTAEPTHASTPKLRETLTPSPTATSTLLPPTDTPIPLLPTDTSTPTLSPTDTPTPTLSPPTDTPTLTLLPPTDTPTPLPTDTSTPPVVTVIEAPTLLNPLPFSAQYRNRIELEWRWPGTLGSDDYYQVEIRNRYNAVNPVIDEAVSPIDVAWVKVSYYQHDYVDVAYDREYTWRVVVVRGTPPGEKQWSRSDYQVWEPSPEFEQISDYSEMWTLFVEEADGPPPPDTSDDDGVATTPK